ncbi:MAG: M48 family metalloprotease [Deltaproteobacteria bacterium]|nr:M48 family metalloprotease [Deltaproteobacteria bacterium]
MVELVEFICGSCQSPNRIKTSQLLRLTRSPRCGKCGSPLFRCMEASFKDLDPACYQHPLDLEALEKLKHIPGIKTLLRKVIRWTVELNLRLSQAANTVQVSEKQLPQIHHRFAIAADRLGIEPLPELFVVQHPYPNATTYGVDQYFVTITTGAIELMNEDEQIAIFAHELGHIHSDHMLYKTAARFVSALAARIAAMSFGLGGLVALPLQLALMWWDRCAELTADRAALLAVRDPEIVLRMLMKTAGGTRSLIDEMSFEAFIEQADRLDQVGHESGWARTLIFAQELFRSHPFPVYRAKEIVAWLTSGNYLAMLDGEYQRKGDQASTPCPACGHPIKADALVCPACGADPHGAPEADDGGQEPAAAGSGADSQQESAGSVQEVFDDIAGAAEGALREAGRTIKSVVDDAGGWWRRSFDARPAASAKRTAAGDARSKAAAKKPKKGGKKRKR